MKAMISKRTNPEAFHWKQIATKHVQALNRKRDRCKKLVEENERLQRDIEHFKTYEKAVDEFIEVLQDRLMTTLGKFPGEIESYEFSKHGVYITVTRYEQRFLNNGISVKRFTSREVEKYYWSFIDNTLTEIRGNSLC